ncbi:hypothetical protein, partial [Neisseria gonorrhoeae]|uniref:hypothetical protein n=1 Tax=Neisseria gonorrhoeae TaxID=485 RepID=UPI0027D965E8
MKKKTALGRFGIVMSGKEAKKKTKDEQSLLLKVGEICRDAAATWTTRKSESINHTAFTFTVKKDG